MRSSQLRAVPSNRVEHLDLLDNRQSSLHQPIISQHIKLPLPPIHFPQPALDKLVGYLLITVQSMNTSQGNNHHKLILLNNIRKNTKLKYKNTKLKYKNTKLKYKNTKLKYKNTKLKYKNTKLKYKNTKLKYKNTKLKYKNTKLKYKI